MSARPNCVRSVLCSIVVAGFTLGIVGCGPKTQGRIVSPTGDTSEADQQKIRGYLEAAGVKGDIYTIVDDGNQWIVDVGAPMKSAPGERVKPDMPTSYLVEKATGKVTGGAEKGGS